MKAKIKETGEVVNVDNLYDDGTALVNGEYIKVSKLNFFETTDWEQVRIQAAIAAMQTLCGQYKGFIAEYYDDIAKWSVGQADALVAQLKKTEEKE